MEKRVDVSFFRVFRSLSVQHDRFWPTTILTLYASSMLIGSGHSKVNKVLKSLEKFRNAEWNLKGLFIA